MSVFCVFIRKFQAMVKGVRGGGVRWRVWVWLWFGLTSGFGYAALFWFWFWCLCKASCTSTYIGGFKILGGLILFQGLVILLQADAVHSQHANRAKRHGCSDQGAATPRTAVWPHGQRSFSLCVHHAFQRQRGDTGETRCGQSQQVSMNRVVWKNYINQVDIQVVTDWPTLTY